ncbi:MAG: hypothetical protein IMZ53_02435 [Thermoplasmata archaeon]|nr:hypothetical protein [Thermoplasmata archaeon]
MNATSMTPSRKRDMEEVKVVSPVEVEYIISQKTSLCVKCGKLMSIFLLNGKLLKSSRWPGTEQTCKGCLPEDVRREMFKDAEELKKNWDVR